MKHTSPIVSAQAAARTALDTGLSPLDAFRHNRIAQIMDGLELPGDGLSDEHLDLYARVRDAVEAAYHAGFFDSRLALGEL